MADANFAEIRALVDEMPGPDLESGTQAVQRQRALVKPPGSLGRLEELAEWLATWQGRHPPQLDRPNVSVFVANHGVAARGVSPWPSEVTRQMLDTFVAGGGAINQISAHLDADLRVHEMALDSPTRDFTVEPAMDEDECARAIAYGMMAVEQGIDVIALGEMGIANTCAAAALAGGLFGGSAGEWVGAGSGARGETLERKAAAVEAALDLHGEAAAEDPLEALRRLGGFELAAITGAVLAARMARTPVVLDGFATTAAAAVVERLAPGGLDHCIAGHLSAEPGHRRLLDILDKEPILPLGMRLGEATGAALAIQVLRTAVACHRDMATFAEAGVSKP